MPQKSSAGVDSSLTRRALLQRGSVGLLGLSLAPLGGASSSHAAESKTGAARKAAAPETLAPLNRFGRMVQEFYVQRVREVERAGNERRAALRTKADAEAYVRD